LSRHGAVARGRAIAPRGFLDVLGAGASMSDDSEIEWHRAQIAENRALLAELEAGNTAGGEVFPETRSEIEHLKAQIAQSELIVAAYEKQIDT
jgi:hypothetical protein